MPCLLPIIANATDFYRERSRPVAAWAAGLQAIAQRHQIVPGDVIRFKDGENPVFALGNEFVVKFILGFRRNLAQQEIDLLTFLQPHASLPAPRLLGHDALEGWYYLLTTRIPGVPLHLAWPDIPTDQRLRLAKEYGQALAALHALPQTEVNPGGIDWPVFCQTSINRWTSRDYVPRLSAALQSDGPRYLAAHGATVIAARCVMLHGDLAPENLIVASGADGWKISGLIDFGNGMRGDPWFDLTAASILLQPGDPTLVNTLLNGYAAGSSERLDQIRPALMVNSLIHPMGEMPACLDLIAGAAECQTWDEVALCFWPD